MPFKISYFDNKNVIKIDCGADFNLALTKVFNITGLYNIKLSRKVRSMPGEIMISDSLGIPRRYIK